MSHGCDETAPFLDDTITLGQYLECGVDFGTVMMAKNLSPVVVLVNIGHSLKSNGMARRNKQPKCSL